jgi:hypothetical protein
MYSVPLPGNMSTRNVAEGTVFTQSAFGDGCLVNNIALEITPLCSSDFYDRNDTSAPQGTFQFRSAFD